MDLFLKNLNGIYFKNMNVGPANDIFEIKFDLIFCLFLNFVTSQIRAIISGRTTPRRRALLLQMLDSGKKTSHRLALEFRRALMIENTSYSWQMTSLRFAGGSLGFPTGHSFTIKSVRTLILKSAQNFRNMRRFRFRFWSAKSGDTRLIGWTIAYESTLS